MALYTKDTVQLINYGRKDCSDMHSYGPIARPIYIIHYVIKGAGFLECDHKRHYIKAGESFLICPYVTAYYYPDPKDPWEYTWVDFRGQEVSRYLEAGSMNREHPICPAITADQIMPLFERLRQLNIYRTNQKEACGILLALLGVYADFYPATDNKNHTESDPRLSTALMLIQANYHHAYFNIEMLCDMIPCNRVTLYRLFQNSLSQSPGQYLNEYRIRQACKMLKRGILVKTTAFSCGFSDQFYFSRMFKQQTGVAPSQYFKKN